MKFSEFAKTSKKEAPEPTMVIDGSFYCQTCGAGVDEADFFQPERILRWVCADKHVSYIEEFTL